ncbi:MAG TPA: SOS response-associated peptidase [Actinomycetes bacterium]|nr:SOS response-associated peptidase [Actinomycetes bacterium]
MCGRYAASRNPDDLVEEFEVERVELRHPLEPDYNVAPTKPVPAVLTRRDRDAPVDSPPVRRLRVLRWGLVPSWAKDVRIGSRLINARVETAAEKPAFRKALAARRCLLPADGFYEWYAEEGRKQPYFIHRADGHPLAMAGLYEVWRDPALDPAEQEAWVWTCTVLTTEAVDEVGRIHDRMPLLVERAAWASWLDPGATDPAAALALLAPPSPGELEAYPVSTRVNNVAHNGAELLDPVPA